MQCFYTLLLCFAKFTLKVTDAADDVPVIFKITENESSIKCNDGIVTKITVLEHGFITIKLSVENEIRIESIKCKASDQAELDLITENPKSDIQNSGFSFQMKVKQDMGIINCTISINKETSNDPNKKIIGHESKPNLNAHCSIQVHVRISEPHQTILVNNAKLPTTRSALEEKNFDHTAIYYYAVGDAVKVSCIILDDSGVYNILMHYDYAEKLDGLYNKILQELNPLGYDFSIKLVTEHHNSVMICTCKGTYDTSTVKVTFIQKDFNDNGYVVVNGHIGRQVFERISNKLIYKYVFKMYETVNVACRSNKTYLTVGDTCTGTVYNNKQVYGREINTPSSFICHLCNKRETLKSFKIDIVQFPQKFTENLPLAMLQLPKSNTLLQLHDYKYGNTWIHYEYYEGENITLKCCQITRTAQCDTIKLNMEYKLNGTVYQENEEITLTTAYDGVIFQCSWKHPDNTKQLTVKFSKKKYITDYAINKETSPDSMEWIIGVVCGLICIIVLCIAILIYKRSQQRVAIPKRRNENDQILHNNDNINAISNEHDRTYANLLKTQNMAAKKNDAVSGQYDSYVNLSKRQNIAAENNDKIIYSEPVNVQGDTYANLSKSQDRAAKKDEKTNNSGSMNTQDGAYANLSKLKDRVNKNNKSKGGTYANLSKIQDRVAKKDKKAAHCGTANIQDDPYANLSKLQDRAAKNDKNINCGPANKEDVYYDQLQVKTEEEPDMNYAELNIDPLNSPNITETPYVEVREMYAKVLPKSARNNRKSYDNVFGNVRYVNSKDTEYVEPTYCQPFMK